MKAKKITVLLCVALMVSILGGCGAKKDEAAAPQEAPAVGVPVETQTVAVQDFERIVTVGGMTAAESTVDVIAKVNGMEQIMSVNAKVGDHVSQGQVLATLNTDSANIQLSSARLAYDDAVRNLERMQPLFEAGAVSQADLDKLQMAVNSAQNNIKSLELALSYATVTAPISGSIVTCNADVGSYASAQAPLFSIANVDTLEVATGINELNVGKLKVGQKVDITVGAIANGKFTGTIKEISKVMDMNTKNYPIKISINNKGGKLMAGMYAEIKVGTDTAKGAIVIPARALVYKDNQPYVMVEENGKAVERAVKTGLNDGNSYVVTEGLAAGDHLIIKGNSGLVNGETVVVMNTTTKDTAVTPDDTGVSEDAKAPATEKVQ